MNHKIKSKSNNKKALISSDIHNPYINTTLQCYAILLPNQMNNKMY